MEWFSKEIEKNETKSDSNVEGKCAKPDQSKKGRR
jgi:hypothetical protein